MISTRSLHVWTRRPRLQNPDIAKEMPTLQFVKDGKMAKTKLVYVCGLGATGSLGLPKYYKPDKTQIENMKAKDVGSSTFRKLSSFSASEKLTDIACGFGFTIIAAKAQGANYTALGFGLNSHSQIGYHAPRKGYPLEIVSTPAPIYLPTQYPVIRVACGRSHSLLLDESGQVFSLGNNSLGQCGRPIVENEIYFGSKKVHQIQELPSDVIGVECGQDHSMFLTQEGKLFSCGWSADGQTGLDHHNNQSSPSEVKGDIKGVRMIKVSSYADTVLALDNEGNVFGWGNTENSQFRTMANCESEQFNVPKHLKFKNIPGKIVDIVEKKFYIGLSALT